jgi:hypothetical protein
MRQRQQQQQQQQQQQRGSDKWNSARWKHIACSATFIKNRLG